MSRFQSLTGKYRSLHPTYPISYITGIEYENTIRRLSGDKSDLQWRIFTFKDRSREEFVWTQESLSDIYLHKGFVGTPDGIRFLSPSKAISLSSVDLDDTSLHGSNPSEKIKKERLTQIVKFTMNAHIDMSYKVFPDTTLVTRILPASQKDGKMRVSYFYNGIFTEKSCTLAEFEDWESSNVAVFFV